MSEFKEKIVFVTGGASGIGRGIVEYFTEQGARVAFCDICEELGEQTAKALGATFYVADVSNAARLTAVLEEVVATFGDIDIIINNAGVSAFAPLCEVSIEEFDKVLATNLRSVFVTSQFMARHRNTLEGRAKYGRIVNSRPLKTPISDFNIFLRSDIFSDIFTDICPQESHHPFEIERSSG